MNKIYNYLFNNLKLTEEINIDKHIKREIVKKILILKNSNNTFTENIYNDLEIFKENNLFSKLNYTKTIFGEHYLENIIKNPLNSISELNDRQNIIKSLMENNIKYNETCSLLNKLNKYEDDLLWFWKNLDQEQSELLNMVYFKTKFLTCMNNSSVCLRFYNYYQLILLPLMGILMPIISFIAPYILLRYKKINIDFKTYYNLMNKGLSTVGSSFNFILSNNPSNVHVKLTKYISTFLYVLFYIGGIIGNIQSAQNLNKINNIIHKKLINLSSYLDYAYKLDELISEDILKLDIIKKKIPELFNPIFKTKPCIFSDKGIILVTFKKVLKNKDEFKELFHRIGIIDSYISICKLYKTHENKPSVFTFSKYVNNKQPQIVIKKFWHPLLNPNNVVKNSISIGKKNDKKNIILTGANASGKSTLIKSIALSIILSQTLTITSCKYIKLTPFTMINTYLNIPDCNGKESLFEAEMHRSKRYIDLLKSMKKHEFAFVIMDEIFSSTNPMEGISGAYSIAKFLSEFENSISIITTHFNYLTNLEKDTNKFYNYKTLVKKKDGNILYPYKIKKGISKQNIALDLLKQKGFDDKIVDLSKKIYSKIINTNI